MNTSSKAYAAIIARLTDEQLLDTCIRLARDAKFYAISAIWSAVDTTERQLEIAEKELSVR
jgi:hypothetical protein